jgi:ATP-dependent RNA helicase DDX46/PRP5
LCYKELFAQHDLAITLPPKPAAFNLGGFAGVGLPMNAGSKLKRSVVALEHDEDEDGPRKLEKLDLPDVDPTILDETTADGTAAIGADLAAEDVDAAEEKPDISEETKGDVKMEVDEPAKKEEEEEEEEDPLDAYMKEIGQDVTEVNRTDAKRLGHTAQDEEEEEKEVQNIAEQKLQEAEALLATAASRSRKKDLPPPDHSKIKYEPFRKAFYTAPIEAMEMDEEEAELLRLEMDGIKVRGQDVPRPVKNWGAFGLPMGCLDLIQRKQWTQPTSIQAQAIPCIMSGRDVIGIAKTGSGKTIAYLLPLFRHVKDQRPSVGLEGPIALVMAPTRELAMQIYSESKAFTKALNFRVACCVGGVSISEDISEMKKGADVVICTPGRMIDLLTANNGRVTNVRRVTYLVLDEADRMFDMGFEPQVMKIISNIRPDAQKVLFSATFPKTMESLARRILQRPLEITVGGRSVVAPEIDQRVEIRDSDTKFTRLLQLLGEYHQANKEEEDDFRTLIFVERQDGADDLFRELLTRGYVCASLHGGKEQVDRDEAITNFKRGDVPTIVATSVAARGLDVKELKLVIVSLVHFEIGICTDFQNYDAPNHMEDYVHRAGRTGRAGNKGTCITFISPDQEKLAVDIVRALEASSAFIPDELKNMSDGESTCTFVATLTSRLP